MSLIDHQQVIALLQALLQDKGVGLHEQTVYLHLHGLCGTCYSSDCDCGCRRCNAEKRDPFCIECNWSEEETL